jgi:hypothetical protein
VKIMTLSSVRMVTLCLTFALIVWLEDDIWYYHLAG